MCFVNSQQLLSCNNIIYSIIIVCIHLIYYYGQSRGYSNSIYMYIICLDNDDINNYHDKKNVNVSFFIIMVQLFCVFPQLIHAHNNYHLFYRYFILVLDGNLLVFNTVQTLHCVCKEWLENLPLLVCSKERPEFFINSAKNTRRKMEDRHSVCVDLNTLYGIKVMTIVTSSPY